MLTFIAICVFLLLLAVRPHYAVLAAVVALFSAFPELGLGLLAIAVVIGALIFAAVQLRKLAVHVEGFLIRTPIPRWAATAAANPRAVKLSLLAVIVVAWVPAVIALMNT